jgi:hypothetical protein
MESRRSGFYSLRIDLTLNRGHVTVH